MQEMTRRNFVAAAGIAAASPALGAMTEGAANLQTSMTVEKDIVFARGGDIDLRLDIYRPPRGAERRMATIHLHGGGFSAGSKDSLSERIRPFAARGYVAIAAQYRLTGQAKWPALIHDVKAAIRWTRANAESLGIDPGRIALVGYSAGGHLALFAAGTPGRAEFEGEGGNAGVSTKVAACLAYYPATDIRPGRGGAANNLLPEGSDEAAHRAASPTTYIAASFPPTAIFHGTEDVTIPLESSQSLFAQLRSAKIPAELHVFDGVPHAFDNHPEFAETCAGLADLFLDRRVINPRTYPPFGARGGGR